MNCWPTFGLVIQGVTVNVLTYFILTQSEVQAFITYKKRNILPL